MRRLLLAALACTTLLVPTFVAKAASLSVSASVLQVVHVGDLPRFEVPAPEPVDLTVFIRTVSGNDGQNLSDPVTHGTYSIPGGAQYYVEYTRQVRNCPPSLGVEAGTGGPFTVGEAGEHVLCVQQSHADGTVTVRTGSTEGPIVEPTVQESSTTSRTGPALHPDETDEQSEPAQGHGYEGSDAPEVASAPLQDDQPPQREASDVTDPASESGR
jgi:hypothetical protein